MVLKGMNKMKGYKQKILEEMGYVEEGWRVDHLGRLICPHGNPIEDDGECPEGCKSPIKEMALI